MGAGLGDVTTASWTPPASTGHLGSPAQRGTHLGPRSEPGWNVFQIDHALLL